MKSYYLVLLVIGVAQCSPAKSLWKSTFSKQDVEEMRSLCAEDDPIACLKLKAISFLDSIFSKDSYQLSENVEIKNNVYRSNDVNARSSDSVENVVENYIKSHDVTFKLPFVDSEVVLGARNLDSDEIDVKVKYNSGSDVSEARKSKLKKILFPILTFVLLKAITLVPLALGLLGLKAWHSLQLAFFSFIVSVGLAVFQLCKKIAADNAAPQIAASGWEHQPYAARSFGNEYPEVIENGQDAQNIAYSAYVQ